MNRIHAGITRVALATAALVLVAGLSFADPGVRIDYNAGIPKVRLDGSWAGSYYTISRGDAPSGPFESLSATQILCTGECFIDDFDAQPGRTYWYRFDLLLPEGGLVSFGPYAVPISADLARRVSVTVSPNPGAGRTQIALLLAGAPSAARLEAVAELFDVQGRSVRTLHRGPLARGITRIEWDGRDRDGHTLGSGVYYLRYATPLGNAITRVLRLR